MQHRSMASGTALVYIKVRVNNMPVHQNALSTSIRHLKVFQAVAQLHGMKKASEACCVTQSAVTQSIAKLEQELGVVLLERRARGCYVNDFGALLLRRVQRMFAQIEKALGDLRVPDGLTSSSEIVSSITRSQIRAVVAIAENGSFTRAAQALAISNRALGREARELERLLRTSLYRETGSGVGTTPAAARLARRLGLALREFELGVQEIKAAQRTGTGELVIGALPLAGSLVMESVIQEVVRACPGTTIKVVSHAAEAMFRSLRHGEVDFVIGLLRQPTPPELVSEKLARTPYVVVARQGHPLTRKRHVTVGDLAGFDWAVGTSGADRRTCFETLFAGRHPAIRLTTCSLSTMKVLLAHSDCLTLLTDYEYSHVDATLACVSCGPVGRVPTLGLTMRRNWLPTRLHVHVLELIRKQVLESLALSHGTSKDKRGMAA